MQMHGDGAAQQLHHSPLPPPLLHIRSGAEHHHLPHPHSHPQLHEAAGLPVPGSARRSSGIPSAGFGTLQLQSSPSMDTSSCRWVRSDPCRGILCTASSCAALVAPEHDVVDDTRDRPSNPLAFSLQTVSPNVHTSMSSMARTSSGNGSFKRSRSGAAATPTESGSPLKGSAPASLTPSPVETPAGGLSPFKAGGGPVGGPLRCREQPSHVC